MVFSCALGLSRVNHVAGGSELEVALEGIVMITSGDVPVCGFDETVQTVIIVSFSNLNHKSSVCGRACVVVRAWSCVWSHAWSCVRGCACMVVCVAVVVRVCGTHVCFLVSSFTLSRSHQIYFRNNSLYVILFSVCYRRFTERISCYYFFLNHSQ